MKKGEKTKQQIILKAIMESYELGFENLSFNKLAKVTELTQPAFYKYFSNKIDLLYNCLLYCAEEGRSFIDSFIDDDFEADKKLIAYLKGNLSWAAERPEQVHILISMYYFSHNSDQIQQTFNIITETGIKRINSILLAGNREGIWSVKKTTELASIIQSILMGEIIKSFNNEGLALGHKALIKNVLQMINSE